MPLISVIVPVYNVKEYLDECIRSILSQTYSDFELILVDDGSTDASGNICDEYAKIDSRIIVIHKENGGLSSARNLGLDYSFSHSTSKFISFVDGDDSIDHNFLYYLMMSIEDGDLAVCYFKKIYVEEKRELFPSFMVDETFDNISIWSVDLGMKGTLNIACNKLYRKKIFNNLRYEGKVCEDSIILHKIIMRCNNITVIPRVLYFYKKHRNSLSTSTPNLTLLNVSYQFCCDRFIFFKNRGLIELSKSHYETAIYSLLSLINQTGFTRQRHKYSYLKQYKSYFVLDNHLSFFMSYPRLFLALRKVKHVFRGVFK